MKPVTLHHCHGGSIQEEGWAVGMGQRQNPFLQIPLHETFHTGEHGIDSGTGVLTWERRWGRQVDHLAWVSWQLGYDVFVHAAVWEKQNRAKTAGLEQVFSQDH